MNPLSPYFEIEDQGTQFKFTPTKAWDRLRKITNSKSKKAQYFIMNKENDFVKMSMNREETKSLTPFWKWKNGTWIIMGESRYRGQFFEHRELVKICPTCGQRIDCECHDSD